MQEQIFRVGSATSQQQRLQQHQQQNQVRSSQVLSNAPANQILARQQTQHQQTKIVTPNKSAQYELLAVKEVFFQVEEAFRAREKEKTKLQDQVSEKENQIKYCEEQTKRQSEAISILTASNSYRNHKISQLSDDINRFNDDMVEPLKDRCSDMDEKLSKGIKILAVMEQDLKPLRILALKQQQVASQLLADLDAAEIKVQLDVDSLTQVNAQNVIIEAAIKTEHQELSKLKEERKKTDQEYSDAEQNYHKVQIKDTALRKILDAAEVQYLNVKATQIEDEVSLQKEVLAAKEAIKMLEMKNQKIQSETSELTIQIACAKTLHASVCAQISKAALEKDLIRTKHIETNDRMSSSVLERKRAVVLCEEAKKKGDNLKEELLSSRESLNQTVERVKEYENNMQNNYSIMSQKMTEQYQLQKLEPGLRCELFQLEELLKNRIRDLRIIVDTNIKQADEEEDRVFTLQSEIKESVRKVDDLENNLVKEREIFNLKNITLRDLEAELESLLLKEDQTSANWECLQTQMSTFEDLEGEIITLKSNSEKKLKVVDTLNRENKEIKSRIFDEEILIANGNYSWEPSESVKARVEIIVKDEEVLMMQILENEFQEKELEIKQQIAKLKEGFPIPAAWLEKADNMRSKIFAAEVHNECVEKDLISAKKNISTLEECRIKRDEENKILNEHISTISESTAALIIAANSTSLLAIPYQEHSPYSLLVDLEESIKYCGDRQDQGKKFSQAPNFSPMENESNLDETDYFDSSQEASEIIGKGSRVQSNPIQQRDPQRQNQAVQNSRESLKATSSTLSNEAPSRKRSVGKNLIKLSQLQGDSTNHDVARLSQTRPFFRPSVANIDNSRSTKINQRLRGTNRHKEQEKMQGSEEGLQSDDDNVSKNTVKDKEEEESGWITESSVCFEDTLFGDSSPKKISVSQKGNMPMSKSVKVAPVFGGDVIRNYSVAGTKSHSFGAIGNVVEHKPLHATIQKDMGALKRKSDKLSVAKEDQGSKNKIPGWKVTAGTDKVKIDRLSASANFENQTTMGANRILDRGNFNEGMMAPPSLPLMTNQRKTLTYEHDPQDTATTKSKSIQGITTVKRKPLSSVGLVGANFTSKVGKDSGNKGAKKISKPLLKISEASDDKNTNPRYPANDGNSVRGKTTRDNTKLDEGMTGGTKGTKGKSGSPGDWFDDDIRF